MTNWGLPDFYAERLGRTSSWPARRGSCGQRTVNRALKEAACRPGLPLTGSSLNRANVGISQ
jgi:hypothetical protein